jgi:hypothetical protein
MTTRREILGAVASGATLVSLSVAAGETAGQEGRRHPRIARAIKELEDAIRYLEAAPHDFGGNKARAIADSRAAIVSLRRALAYRAEKDERHHG